MSNVIQRIEKTIVGGGFSTGGPGGPIRLNINLNPRYPLDKTIATVVQQPRISYLNNHNTVHKTAITPSSLRTQTKITAGLGLINGVNQLVKESLEKQDKFNKKINAGKPDRKPGINPPNEPTKKNIKPPPDKQKPEANLNRIETVGRNYNLIKDFKDRAHSWEGSPQTSFDYKDVPVMNNGGGSSSAGKNINLERRAMV